LVGHEATKQLLSTYAATPTPARGGTGTSVITTERTPMRREALLSEARSIRALVTAETPLKGGENPNLEGLGDFSGITPKPNPIQTPNPLLTPSTSSSSLSSFLFHSSLFTLHYSSFWMLMNSSC
jgi:pre-mRNA-splicing factor CDC5/CEF1